MFKGGGAMEDREPFDAVFNVLGVSGDYPLMDLVLSHSCQGERVPRIGSNLL